MAMNRNKGNHRHIIECMQALGYEANEDGICSGIVAMSIRSYLYGSVGINKFRERLDLISKFTPQELKIKIENAKQKLAKVKSLKEIDADHSKGKVELTGEVGTYLANSKEILLFKNIKEEAEKGSNVLVDDLNFIDILEFFEGIHIYSEPYTFPFLFDKPTYELEEILLVSPLIKSPELFPNDPVVNSGSSIGGYTLLQLEDYFKLLLPAFNASTTNISMFIENCGHAINVTFDHERQLWRVLDANQMEIDSFAKDNTRDLADFVWKAFDKSKHTLFSVDFYARESEKSFAETFQAIKKTEEWNKLHNLSDQIKMEDKNHSTIFLVAAKHGELEKIKECLELDKNLLNKTNAAGISALAIAISYGHLNVARYLIEQGANVTLVNKPLNMTPLHHASMVGMVPIIDDLLQKNKSMLNQADASGVTPLHYAVHFGNEAVVVKLLEKEARLDLLTKDGLSAIQLAAARGHIKILELLIEKGASIQKKTDMGRTLLHLAAENGEIKTVKYLLEKKLRAGDPDKSGITALELAVLHNHTEVVQILLNSGGNANYHSKDCGPLLHAAIKNNNVEMVKLLLTAKASLYALDQENNSAAHLAAVYGNSEILRLLLAHGADVNAANTNSQTPLLVAAKNNHVECVKELLINGKGRIQFDSTLASVANSSNPPVSTIMTRYQKMKTIKETNVKSPRHQAILALYQKGWEAKDEVKFKEVVNQFRSLDAQLNSSEYSNLDAEKINHVYQKYVKGEDYTDALKTLKDDLTVDQRKKH